MGCVMHLFLEDKLLSSGCHQASVSLFFFSANMNSLGAYQFLGVHQFKLRNTSVSLEYFSFLPGKLVTTGQ